MKSAVTRTPLIALVGLIGVALSLFHIYTSIAGVYPASTQRSIHLLGVLAIAFLSVRSTKPKRALSRSIDILFAIGGVASCIYIIASFQDLLLRAGMPNTTDVIFGWILIIVVLEAARRTIGPAMSLIAVVFMIYAYFGPYMPALISHRGVSLRRIVGFVYLGDQGIFGLPLGVAATYVIMFIIFGTFLTISGAGEVFLQLAYAIAGRWTGGAAKAAILASGLVGSITGVATANVVITGSFTIPLMKRSGYRPRFAAAVEAAASTGGQLMPPVMGATAFVMAEFLSVPYRTIALAAIIPALLYFYAVGAAVHFEAKRAGLKGGVEAPDIRGLLLRSYLFIIPMTILVVQIMLGYSPMRAAFWSIVSMLALRLLDRKNPLKLADLYAGLATAARSAVGIGAACATAGIIIGLVNVTGLGLRLSSVIIHLAGGNSVALLLLIMLTSLVLGLGLPTVGAYVIAAILAAPALIEVGFNPIAAHFFVFFFAMMANVTPPVCIAAYTAAGIAGSDPVKTGVEAFKLALAGFIIAFAFVYSPVLLLIDGTIVSVGLATLSAFVGTTALAAAVVGHFSSGLRLWQRILIGVGAVLMIFPGILTDLAGLLVLVLVLGFNVLKSRASVRDSELEVEMAAE